MVEYYEDGYDSAIKHLWLNNIEGDDIKYILELKRQLGNVWNIYDAGEKVLRNFIPESIAKKIVNSKGEGRSVELYERLNEKGISILYPENSAYPDKLRNIYLPPQLLYIKGRIKKLINEYNKTIGIVGSRNTSVYGKEICRYFSEVLSNAGFNIVSGMARGIDGIAQKTAVDNNAYTVAVLGSGINVVYPRSNMELYAQIEEKGTIISEYGLDVAPHPWQFPIRNRIISGLSDSILVVEARLNSGSLITVEHAIQQGKTVFSIPGRLMDRFSEGSNSIIRDGAICVTKPEDIMEDMMGVVEKTNILDSKDNAGMCVSCIRGLSAEEEKILSLLSLEPMYIDEIIQKTHLGITNTISLLYVLEEKDMIKQPLKGYFIRYIKK